LHNREPRYTTRKLGHFCDKSQKEKQRYNNNKYKFKENERETKLARRGSKIKNNKSLTERVVKEKNMVPSLWGPDHTKPGMEWFWELQPE
jgi:hypothetical protein